MKTKNPSRSVLALNHPPGAGQDADDVPAIDFVQRMCNMGCDVFYSIRNYIGGILAPGRVRRRTENFIIQFKNGSGGQYDRPSEYIL